MQVSLAEIRGSWSEEKKAFNRQFPWNYYVSRRLSFYFTWVFLRLGVSANQATWFSLAIGVLAAAAFFTGAHAGFVVGALLYNLFLVLDAVDGNIARVTGSSSAAGKFYDIVVGLLVEASFFSSIGVGLMVSGAAPAFGALALLASTAMVLRKLIELRFSLAMGGAPSAHEAEDERRSAGASTLRLVYLNLLRFNGIRLPWLFVAALTGTLEPYVVFYFALSGADLLLSVGRYVQRADAA